MVTTGGQGGLRELDARSRDIFRRIVEAYLGGHVHEPTGEGA